MSDQKQAPPDSQKERKGFNETFASHYAMQVALQTMKERCQLLQQRLSTVEEDNLRLRIECQNNNRDKTDEPSNETNKFEEQITQLVREKSQLVNRISMVAKENNKLWTRLSKLTEANQSLGDHMSKISDTLNKHPIGDSSILSNSAQTLKKDDSVDTEESLEEISLKIIDGIKKEKEELEQQCKQMVELKSGAGVSIGECEFALNGMDGVESVGEGVTDDLRSLRDRMRHDLTVLKEQQTELKTAITLFGERRCKKCVDREKREEEERAKEEELEKKKKSSRSALAMDELQRQLAEVAEPPPTTPCPDVRGRERERGRGEVGGRYAGDDEGGCQYEDRICPMCSQFFAADVLFSEFNDHVLDHFKTISDDDKEPDSIINRYEVIG